MRVSFRSGKLQRELCEERKLSRVHGPRRSELIKRRLAEMEYAPTLAILRTLPGPRCHELTGDRKGQLSVDLDHPYRLIFVPDHDPVPRMDTGGMDWRRVTAVTILEVTDTHE